ncbi:hypothetical protein PAECIP111891_06670 [Paenibacillus allorhizoplanae]|uniref:DUF4446 family protein n=1 Tax=Paenibacillus allorhizoplanae TaxID=2905648 RepID=A0ABN8H5S5_9BACL|nr:DUF4446 family protein [Paenibacillus allorhizoplanae]CAH1230413.1 hypothetical protein PAECIP111891_06670 [Paenibacillus allorhizoplanae]
MGELFGLNAEYVMLICFAFILVLLVMVIIISIRLSSLRKRYTRMINGTSAENMEQLLIDMQNALNEQKAESVKASTQISNIHQSMKKMTSNIKVRRYNAFNEGGSDLSFSLAMLNEEQDGVIITGIHSREQMYVYAKPIAKGQSSYTLSPEEKETLTQTLKQS